METRLRSLAKALCWRISGTFVTSLLVFIWTRKLDWSLEIGLVEFSSKLIIYYGHERFWLWITWGRKKTEPPPEKIPERTK